MGRPKDSKSVRITWTNEEVDYLLSVYKDKHKSEIVEDMTIKFNRKFTLSGISCKMKTLGIKGKGKKIVNGLTPWNKGIKGANIANKTSFKKGNVPHNKSINGSEKLRKDGYIWIKHDDKWILKQRYVYEQHHGKIPEGYKIIFLDADKTNLDIDNLKAVSTKEMFTMNKEGFIRKNPKLTEIGLNVVRLEAKVREIEK